MMMQEEEEPVSVQEVLKAASRKWLDILQEDREPYNAPGTCSRARKHARAQDSLALPVNSSFGR